MENLARGGYTAAMKTHRILLLASVLAWSCSASAQWQWIDKDGRKVYSDRPPPAEVPEKNVIVQPGGARPGFQPNMAPAKSEGVGSASRPATSEPKPTGIDKDLEDRKKQAEDAEAAKKKAEEEKIAKARAENCKRAREGKATLDSGIRVAQMNAQGERVIMDDAARAAETKRLQGIIDSDCK
jgi:uncharacterized protein DUF4124